AGRVVVEKAHLRDGRGSDERGVLPHLRANLEAAPAGHAGGKDVVDLLVLGRLPGPRTEIVGAVDGNPPAHPLERLEHLAAVDGEVADEGELLHRREGDGLLEAVDERGAGL